MFGGMFLVEKIIVCASCITCNGDEEGVIAQEGGNEEIICDSYLIHYI